MLDSCLLLLFRVPLEVNYVSEYRKGDVYVCCDPSCGMEIMINKGCTGESCSDCGPLLCCDKPMVKKSDAPKKKM